MWISLGVGVLVLLCPAAAQAASARVRALNAVASGTVTIQVDATPLATKLAPGRESTRFALSAGAHTITAVRGTRTVARRSITLRSGERVTIVYANTDGRPALRLLREPSPATGATMLRVANYSDHAGAVDIRVGGLAVARGLDPNRVAAARRFDGALSPTGLATVTARPHTGALLTAARPLVLATRSVGIFAIVPRRRGSRLIRLAYDTAPPTPTRQPAVTGLRRFGNAVRCDSGAWTPSRAKVTSRWTVDGADAGSATALTLTAARVGHLIGCTVTAAANGATTRARTTFTLPPVPAVVTLPFIELPAGELGDGDIATCNVGTWQGNPSTFAIRWLRVTTGDTIGSDPQYTLHTAADNGLAQSIGCEVAATNDGGTSASHRSSNTAALSIPPTVAIVPTTKPPPSTVDPDVFFHWTIGGGGANTVECARDNLSFGPCIGQFAQAYRGLATAVNGLSHTFTVRVSNVAGMAIDSYTWKVLPPPPHVTISAPDPAPDTSATFAWVSDGGPADFTCEFDHEGFLPCTSPATRTNLAPSMPHTFSVQAANANPTTPMATDSYDWTAGP